MACRESDSTLGTAHRSFSVGLKSTASNQLSNQRLWNCIRYIFYCQSSFSLLVKLQELQGRSFLSDLGVPALFWIEGYQLMLFCPTTMIDAVAHFFFHNLVHLVMALVKLTKWPDVLSLQWAGLTWIGWFFF